MPKSLNDITEADLLEINSLAAVYFTPREVAIILEVDINSFVEECNQEGTRSFLAYNTGILKSEYELRTAITKLAKSGSSPAQTLSLDLLRKAKANKSDT